jgi:hypothetical protein
VAHIIGGRTEPAAITDQAVRAMPPAARKQFRAELDLLAADATLDLLRQLGMSQAEIRKALKQGSLKSIRKGGHVASKKRKARVICPGCDRRMKPRDVACRKCGTRRPGGFAETGSAAKALFVPAGGAAPFLVKGARAAPPEPRLRVVKSAEDIQREVFLAKHRAEYRPEYREEYWKSAHPEIYGQGGSAS